MKKLILVANDGPTDAKIQSIFQNHSSSFFEPGTSVKIYATRETADSCVPRAKKIKGFIEKQNPAVRLPEICGNTAFSPSPGPGQHNERAYDWVQKNDKDIDVVVVVTENKVISGFVSYASGIVKNVIPYSPNEGILVYDLEEKTKVDIFKPQEAPANA